VIPDLHAAEDVLSTTELRDVLRVLGRATNDEFDLQRALTSLLNNVSVWTGARGAYLKKHVHDRTRSEVIATSEGGATLGLEGSVATHPIAVISEGVPIATLVLLRDSARPTFTDSELARAQVASDCIAIALRRAQFETRLYASEEALRQALEAKYKVIGGIAVALKNTLSGAAGYMQLLDMQDKLSATQTEYVGRSRGAIQAAVSLINEMVELARAEAGDLPFERGNVNIGAFARDAVRNHQEDAERKRILLTVEVPHAATVIQSDPSYVRQILDAMLFNAVRYTPEGGCVAVRIEMRDGRRLGDPDRWICVTVQDTGPGMADPGAVFEEISRAEKPGGRVGFRMAICRRIARLLGGDMTVDSRLGRGTAFTLWLPAGITG